MPADWSKLGGDCFEVLLRLLQGKLKLLRDERMIAFVENNVSTGIGCPSAGQKFKTTTFKSQKSVQRVGFRVIFCQVATLSRLAWRQKSSASLNASGLLSCTSKASHCAPPQSESICFCFFKILRVMGKVKWWTQKRFTAAELEQPNGSPSRHGMNSRRSSRATYPSTPQKRPIGMYKGAPNKGCSKVEESFILGGEKNCDRDGPGGFRCFWHGKERCHLRCSLHDTVEGAPSRFLLQRYSGVSGCAWASNSSWLCGDVAVGIPRDHFFRFSLLYNLEFFCNRFKRNNKRWSVATEWQSYVLGAEKKEPPP